MGHRNTVADTCQAVVKGGASLGVLLAVMVCTGTAAADVCTVPSAPHPTLQAAVDDAYCAEIVLAAQTFVESVVVARDLTLRGASSTSTVIEGRLVVEGNTTQVVIHDLKVDGSAPSVAGCFSEALVAQGGAQISANEVVVINGGVDGCVLFGDGFESGTTSAWSATKP
jgi:nitrous oxidase accessory protein NosD